MYHEADVVFSIRFIVLYSLTPSKTLQEIF